MKIGHHKDCGSNFQTMVSLIISLVWTFARKARHNHFLIPCSYLHSLWWRDIHSSLWNNFLHNIDCGMIFARIKRSYMVWWTSPIIMMIIKRSFAGWRHSEAFRFALSQNFQNLWRILNAPGKNPNGQL